MDASDVYMTISMLSIFVSVMLFKIEFTYTPALLAMVAVVYACMAARSFLHEKER